PGGNMTGINFFAGEVLAKRLELLRELVPKALCVAVFVNPANPARAETQVNELQTAAGAMGLQLQIFNTSSTREINEAFATLAQNRADALFVSAGPFESGGEAGLDASIESSYDGKKSARTGRLCEPANVCSWGNLVGVCVSAP